MIAIIDYEMGNLRSVQKGFEHVGKDAVISGDPKEIIKAEKIVLPGVGAFAKAVYYLEKLKLKNVIIEMAEKGTPLLGICLGKQLLMEESEEGESAEGLGLVKGKVIKFEKGKKIPHIGWNQIIIKKQVPILKNIPDGTFFYFVHSYYAVPNSPENVITATDYEGEFPSIVGRDNIYGIQFHPEKSQTYGLEILKNFAEL
ncbi:imidazole glycerol phosphate synthase subunit HisH [bacterium]|nr:imidazole glycerol phosphate synthase subunit HisH [bacterium]